MIQNTISILKDTANQIPLVVKNNTSFVFYKPREF